MYSDLLAKAYPSIEVDASLIFIRDGNIYTSGGITTGIDLALALVEEDVGTEVMLGVARALIVFPRRPGGQSQFKGYTSILEKPIRPNVSELQAWMQAHPKADLSVPALAERMAMSPRNFSRLFHSETGLTSAQFAEQVRADAARCKLEQTTRRSRSSPRNAGSLIPSACGVRFNAFSTLAACPITGDDFDQPSELNSTIVRVAKPPPNRGRGGSGLVTINPSDAPPLSPRLHFQAKTAR